MMALIQGKPLRTNRTYEITDIVMIL